MSENTNSKKIDSDSSNDFKSLLEQSDLDIPQMGDVIKGTVISASRSEVRLDINGILTGIVRGNELYQEAPEYADLKPGDEVEATVVEAENENGELELSFRYAGQEKAWKDLHDAYDNKKIVKVRVVNANRGGLLANYKQIAGFLPVSQLAPENYPRVNGGDKSKILDKLKSFIGQEIEVRVVTLDTKEEKIIFSEKDAWTEKQQHIISKYKIGTIVEGKITAITDFGVFITFGEGLEGLIHISELAWQRIDDPNDLYKVGDKIKVEVIGLEGSKIFLSAKKLMHDPWEGIEKKYKTGQEVKGRILKINPFGLFVQLDDDIHGLAHVTQLELAPGQKITDMFNIGEERSFKVLTVEPKEHRLGLSLAGDKKRGDKKEVKNEKDNTDAKEEKPAKEEKKTKAATEKKEKKEKKVKPAKVKEEEEK